MGNPHCRIGKVRLKGMENVVRWRGVTSLDTAPSIVLAGAMARGLREVVIIGYDADGCGYFSTNLADGAAALWHLEWSKQALLLGD